MIAAPLLRALGVGDCAADEDVSFEEAFDLLFKDLQSLGHVLVGSLEFLEFLQGVGELGEEVVVGEGAEEALRVVDRG